MNREINRLLNFGLQQGLIKEEDYCYAANRLLAVLKIDEFEPEQVEEVLPVADGILDKMLDYAAEKG